MSDGVVYEVGGRDAADQPPPRGPWWRVPVAGAALVGLVAGGVALARDRADLDAAPPATPSESPSEPAPPPDLLDEDGYGEVRLGMRASDYLRLYQSGDQSGRRFTVTGTDSRDGCVQYEYDDPASDTVVWTWVRADVVVTVGVELRRLRTSARGAPRSSAGAVNTAFGATLGEVARDPARQGRGWQRSEEAGVVVLSGTLPVGEARVADLRGDGAVDAALVALPGAAACERDEAAVGVVAEEPVIEGSSVSGAALGDAVATFRADGTWTENTLAGDDACRVFVSDDGATALVAGDRVVALSAAGLVEGPALGDSVAAVQGTVPSTRGTRVSVDQLTGRLLGESLDLADGRRLTLAYAPQPVLVAALDRVYGLGPDVVTEVVLGRPCG